MKGYVYNFEEKQSEVFGYFSKIRLGGCNLNCPFCPFPGIKVFNDASLIDFFELKTSMKLTDRTIITGGEPLLQGDFILLLNKMAKENNKDVIVETNISRPKALKNLIESGIKNFIVRWWSYEEERFNRLTSAKTYFSSHKEVLYDIFMSLHIMHQNSITPWFKFTMIPGLNYTKNHILEEVEFISNFGFLPNIILTPLDLEKANGRWKMLKPLGETYLQNLKESIEKQGFKVFIDKSLN